MRMPVKIVGTAEGRTTFAKSWRLDRPRVRAARTRSGSTVRTPATVLSSTGKKAA